MKYDSFSLLSGDQFQACVLCVYCVSSALTLFRFQVIKKSALPRVCIFYFLHDDTDVGQISGTGTTSMS